METEEQIQELQIDPKNEKLEIEFEQPSEIEVELAHKIKSVDKNLMANIYESHVQLIGKNDQQLSDDAMELIEEDQNKQKEDNLIVLNETQENLNFPHINNDLDNKITPSQGNQQVIVVNPYSSQSSHSSGVSNGGSNSQKSIINGIEEQEALREEQAAEQAAQNSKREPEIDDQNNPQIFSNNNLQKQRFQGKDGEDKEVNQELLNQNLENAQTENQNIDQQNENAKNQMECEDSFNFQQLSQLPDLKQNNLQNSNVQEPRNEIEDNNFRNFNQQVVNNHVEKENEFEQLSQQRNQQAESSDQVEILKIIGLEQKETNQPQNENQLDGNPIQLINQDNKNHNDANNFEFVANEMNIMNHGNLENHNKDNYDHQSQKIDRNGENENSVSEVQNLMKGDSQQMRQEIIEQKSSNNHDQVDEVDKKIENYEDQSNQQPVEFVNQLEELINMNEEISKNEIEKQVQEVQHQVHSSKSSIKSKKNSQHKSSQIKNSQNQDSQEIYSQQQEQQSVIQYSQNIQESISKDISNLDKNIDQANVQLQNGEEKLNENKNDKQVDNAEEGNESQEIMRLMAQQSQLQSPMEVCQNKGEQLEKVQGKPSSCIKNSIVKSVEPEKQTYMDQNEDHQENDNQMIDLDANIENQIERLNQRENEKQDQPDPQNEQARSISKHDEMELQFEENPKENQEKLSESKGLEQHLDLQKLSQNFEIVEELEIKQNSNKPSPSREAFNDIIPETDFKQSSNKPSARKEELVEIHSTQLDAKLNSNKPSVSKEQFVEHNSSQHEIRQNSNKPSVSKEQFVEHNSSQHEIRQNSNNPSVSKEQFVEHNSSQHEIRQYSNKPSASKEQFVEHNSSQHEIRQNSNKPSVSREMLVEKKSPNNENFEQNQIESDNVKLIELEMEENKNENLNQENQINVIRASQNQDFDDQLLIQQIDIQSIPQQSTACQVVQKASPSQEEDKDQVENFECEILQKQSSVSILVEKASAEEVSNQNEIESQEIQDISSEFEKPSMPKSVLQNNKDISSKNQDSIISEHSEQQQMTPQAENQVREQEVNQDQDENAPQVNQQVPTVVPSKPSASPVGQNLFGQPPHPNIYGYNSPYIHPVPPINPNQTSAQNNYFVNPPPPPGGHISPYYQMPPQVPPPQGTSPHHYPYPYGYYPPPPPTYYPAPYAYPYNYPPPLLQPPLNVPMQPLFNGAQPYPQQQQEVLKTASLSQNETVEHAQSKSKNNSQIKEQSLTVEKEKEDAYKNSENQSKIQTPFPPTPAQKESQLFVASSSQSEKDQSKQPSVLKEEQIQESSNKQAASPNSVEAQTKKSEPKETLNDIEEQEENIQESEQQGKSSKLSKKKSESVKQTKDQQEPQQNKPTDGMNSDNEREEDKEGDEESEEKEEGEQGEEEEQEDNHSRAAEREKKSTKLQERPFSISSQKDSAIKSIPNRLNSGTTTPVQSFHQASGVLKSNNKASNSFHQSPSAFVGLMSNQKQTPFNVPSNKITPAQKQDKDDDNEEQLNNENKKESANFKNTIPHVTPTFIGNYSSAKVFADQAVEEEEIKGDAEQYLTEYLRNLKEPVSMKKLQMRYSMLEPDVVKQQVSEFLGLESLQTIQLPVPKNSKSSSFRMEYYLIDEDQPKEVPKPVVAPLVVQTKTIDEETQNQDEKTGERQQLEDMSDEELVAYQRELNLKKQTLMDQKSRINPTSDRIQQIHMYNEMKEICGTVFEKIGSLQNKTINEVCEDFGVSLDQ